MSTAPFDWHRTTLRQPLRNDAASHAAHRPHCKAEAAAAHPPERTAGEATLTRYDWH